jgi:hypothetical protein
MKRPAIVTTLLLLGGIAWGGAKLTYNVSISTSSQTASGAIGTVRNSADTSQYIGCYTGTNTSGSWGYCAAHNTGTTYASCQTTNGAMINTMRSLTDGSYVWFAWDDSGECTQIQAHHYSFYEPKQ